MRGIINSLRDLTNYPSAVFGLLIIAGLIGVALYAVATIPYNEAIRLWRGGEDVWRDYPRNARPIWTDWFSAEKLPRSLVIDSEPGTAPITAEKTIEQRGGLREATIIFPINFTYDDFPREILLYMRANFDGRQPHVEMTWHTPDGREIRAGEVSARPAETYRFSQDQRLLRRLGGLAPRIGFFAEPDSDPPVPLKGEYELHVSALLFDEDDDIDVRLMMHGQVHGLGGTDHRRRDLMVALLWGTPIALSFGLLAAVGTTATTMVIAAVGVWFGGLVDATIQRITEVNLILPILPILIMVGTFYSRSIWVILGVVIVLGIFSAAIKTYRAAFLQVRESPYIEAAQAYGAGNGRIILRYLLPRMIPLLIPQLVILIPAYVFLEASLAVLGLGDPVLPTWGKIINDAQRQGALHNGYYYWVIEPAVLLMLTGLGFTMVGNALDRVFNPRLRGL